MGYIRNDEGVDPEYVTAGMYELDVATIRVPCAVSLAPLYDAKMETVRNQGNYEEVVLLLTETQHDP